MKPILTEKYFVSAGEANAEHELSLPKLTSDLIDIATAHANMLGVGNPAMEHMNSGWVLSRLTIDMKSYPRANQQYLVSTWVETFNRHFSERSFRIELTDGTVCGYARSVWMVINFIDRTNVGLSHLSLPGGTIDGTEAPIPKQKKHVAIISQGETPDSKIYAVSPYPPINHRFQYCDLDFYRHVNTVRYVELILNRFSLAQHDSHMVRRLELAFMNEATPGMDTQLLEAQGSEEGETAFLLRTANGKQPLFFSRLFRIPRPQ